MALAILELLEPMDMAVGRGENLPWSYRFSLID